MSPTFGHDQTLFVAGLEAGLRVLHDGGNTWADAGAGLDNAAVYGVAISPRAENHHLIFAATDAGVYRSRDAGASWEPPTPDGDFPTGIIIAGVAADGGRAPIVAATLDRRLIASDDGGERWNSLDTPFDGATIVSLALSPDDARNRTLYAGRIAPVPTDGMAKMSVWRSTDGGERWERWLQEPGVGGILPLAVSAGDDDEKLFVGLAGQVVQPRRNAWQTRGGTRAPLWHGPSLTTEHGDSASITALAVSPNYPADGMIFAATSAGIYRSRTHGRAFDRWSAGLPPVLALSVTTDAAHHPAGDNLLLVFALGVDGTIWRRATDDV